MLKSDTKVGLSEEPNYMKLSLIIIFLCLPPVFL